MASIFLSYSRENFSVARSLAGALERIGHSVWWDRHIKGASQFAAEIEAALGKAEAVIVLWSEQSVGSPWVRDGFGGARQRAAGAGLDRRHAAADGLSPISVGRPQRMEGTPQLQAFAALIEALDGVLSGRGPREVVPPDATKGRRRSSGAGGWRRLRRR